ncbi:GntR family transcriptional regulator [Amycolatopsis rubida]|uniref:DNA-binding transcriptional regulator, GntR family n=1 Tax=Amycolatopsis rubida TaxID=112413 RepID=A0A1I5FG00_9PSEU|nr:GntR family transcriptional regulator [Amycolatopsis rubida]SFO22685.1 DNA-binding transcriptional regulator, GntR family [Amycolatopsis rubida]
MRYEPDLIREHPPTGSLMENAYRRLKREIIELDRAPGATFTELEVATAFGLSKTPVREALARLHRDGLVRPLPRAGYVVSPVTLGDATDLCDMRALLQSQAAALCAERGLPAADGARLAELAIDTDEDQLGGPHFEERFRANYEFESIIANGSGNHRLAAASIGVLDEIERISRLSIRLDPSMPPERLRERQAVVDAIAARDPDAARAAMRRRTTSARRETIGALAASRSITDAEIAVP